MARLHYLPDNQEIEVDPNQTLLDAFLTAGIPIIHACGGNARCSTCRVMVLEGLDACSPRTEHEEKLAAHLHFDNTVRLACQTNACGSLSIRRLVLDCEDEKLAAGCVGNPEPTSPGEEKSLAILFADIRGFTSFSESLLPYDIIHTLNRYYHHVGQAIEKHGGTVNSYAGDGFMAVFGLDDTPGSTLRAVRAGLEMLEIVEKLKPYYQTLYGQSFDVRIGVHYGEAVVGSVGFCSNRTTTIIGDAVNFASRTEAANKLFNTSFLISGDAHNQISEKIESRPLDPVPVPGKSGLHPFHQVLGLKN